MARQDPGEPFFRIDSDEANAILVAQPEDAVMVDVRRDDEWVHGTCHRSNPHTHR